MKTLLKVVAVVCLSALCVGQTHTFPALDTNNVFTGQNTFNLFIFGNYTVSTLPGSPIANMTVIVTDGNSGSDCTTGGGSNRVLCSYTGSAWQAIGGGCGGSPAAGPVGTIQSTDGSGNFVASNAVDNGTVFVVSEPLQVLTSPGSPPLTAPEFSSAVSGISGSGILWPYSTNHHWAFNNNAGGVFYIPGVATAGTPGDCWGVAANGIDLTDTPCGSGGGGNVNNSAPRSITRPQSGSTPRMSKVSLMARPDSSGWRRAVLIHLGGRS